ncbi:MAG: cysteine--tRNA ligase [Candidatus Aenigmarchaeota archaeon]|nr:cysteine--tRNA ligase [Candidatus Aenigmarchaeota archaeon]
MAIKVYNTLTKKKEVLKPIEDKIIRMYVCGPTVYDYSHLGHARTYIVFDIIRRYLKYRGYRVKLVINITDIDDKIIKRAKELGITPKELAEKMTKEFFKDIEALKIKPATYYPKATETIPEIIKLIEKLIKNGYAYEVDGDVFFSVEKFKDYGKLSGNREEALKKGARIEINPKKKNPADFTLWKKAKPGEPSWPSPWGPGRPGWHIECSAMNLKFLGETIDIHGGGMDLIFPHHENEIAQSESVTGKPFVRYWIHTGMVQIGGEKMAKSKGNFRLIRDILRKYPAETIRLFLVRTNYRSPIDFTEENLNQSDAARRRLQDFFDRLSDLNGNGTADKEVEGKLKETKEKFDKYMNDDFSTAQALAEIFNFVRFSNKKMDNISEKTAEKIKEFLLTVNEIFDILRVKEEKIPKEIIDLAKKREKLRKEKKFKEADKIREEIRKRGYLIEDKKDGTRIRKI